VIVADVAPDVLHVAVVNADGGNVVMVAVGAGAGVEFPLPAQAASVTPSTARSAQSAPRWDPFFRIFRPSLWPRKGPHAVN
jgi:hypothetical protein